MWGQEAVYSSTRFKWKRNQWCMKGERRSTFLQCYVDFVTDSYLELNELKPLIIIFIYFLLIKS